ncbi:MAG: hypothetical protein MUC60_08135 [Oscillatoria sp. Prado101]|jgi:hypothetical protein|nr:hypothetical protein [Oscillatoria sp. Prado101]
MAGKAALLAGQKFVVGLQPSMFVVGRRPKSSYLDFSPKVRSWASAQKLVFGLQPKSS